MARFVKAQAVPLPPMVRRSFRFGLRLGLLFGVAVALVKTLQSRRSTPEAAPPPAPWEPISEKPPVREPFVARTPEPVIPEPEPVVPESEPLDEVGEPILTFADDTDPALDVVPEAAPIKAPAVKKAAKKAAPAKKAAKKTATPPAPPAAWVEAEGGVCPTTHPVKAKMASRLFHLPGMFAYDRTRPDRCYLDAPSAVEDGFTSAKR